MSQNQNSDLVYEKLIYENQDKFYRLYLTVSEFRDKYYVNIRKYFQSYEGDFVPSKEGISMEASINNISSLLEGLLEIVSQEEGRETITKIYNQYCNDQ
jgi:subtilase family serine protease